MAETTFPEFITTRRRELELTLGDVASEVGVSPITVSNWSNGQSTPKKQNLVALAEVLEIPADELADMAGVLLDPPRKAEADPEVVLERVQPAPDGGDAAPAKKYQEPPVVGIPSVEHPTLAAAEEAAAAEVVVEAAKPPQVEEKIEDAGESELDREAEEVAESATASGPDVIPRVVAPPTTTQLTPLTYVQDPKQLLRYRIRWGITTVALIIMAFVLIWALAGLFDALSAVKESVTP